MKKLFRKILIIMCIMVLSSGAAWANAARASWEGRDRAGLIVTDDNCPVIVEKELLTFDLQEFPVNRYTTREGFLSYEGKVTAEYTFRNPADYEVTATLAFPFGNEPCYAFQYDAQSDMAEKNTDTEKYDITVNGEVIERELRHTFSYRDSDFDLKDDLPRLVDGYMYDWFYNPQMPVTKFVYEVSGVDEDAYSAADLAFLWKADRSTRRVFLEDHSGLKNTEEGMMLSSWAENGKDKVVYIIGKLPEEPIEWKLSYNDSFGNEKEIECEVVLRETTEMTLNDFVLSYWSEESGVSQTDWYNAVITQFNLRDFGQGILSTDTSLDVSADLMRWYKYDITVGPGETIVNTVTAPIYPSIDENKKVPVYDYTYLLSPAKTWADFGRLDVVINTPFYMADSNIKGFEKTENGYSLSMDGLPNNELEFTLCSEEKTSISAAPLLAVAAGLIVLGIYIRRKTHSR